MFMVLMEKFSYSGARMLLLTYLLHGAESFLVKELLEIRSVEKT